MGLLNPLRQAQDFRREEGVDDREKKDHGRDQVERLGAHAADQDRPHVGVAFILIRFERRREWRRSRRRLRRNGQDGEKSQQAQREKKDEAIHGDPSVMKGSPQKIKALSSEGQPPGLCDKSFPAPARCP